MQSNRLRSLALAAMLAIQPLALSTLAHAATESASESTDANAPQSEQHNPIADLPWRKGPTPFQLGGHATLQIPGDHAALAEGDSGRFLELTGNLPSPGTSIVASSNWWATFDYDDSGYIKDDEKIDADALLKQLKEEDGPANEERRKHHMPELYTDGWFVPPHYDKATQRLEWALKLHASDDPAPVINYTVRILGRQGYERAVLVSSPDTMEKDVAEFKQMLNGFDFNSGMKYTEFKPGDRVAEIGLAALIAGGAAAVATKTGFWKVLAGILAAGWKLIAGLVFAAIAAVRGLFKRKD